MLSFRSIFVAAVAFATIIFAIPTPDTASGAGSSLNSGVGLTGSLSGVVSSVGLHALSKMSPVPLVRSERG